MTLTNFDQVSSCLKPLLMFTWR